MLVILFMNVIAPVIDYGIDQGEHQPPDEAPCRDLTPTSLHARVRRRGLRRLRAAGRRRRRSACASGRRTTSSSTGRRTCCSPRASSSPARSCPTASLQAIFDKNIVIRLIDLKTGEMIPDGQDRRRGPTTSEGAQRPGAEPRRAAERRADRRGCRTTAPSTSSPRASRTRRSSSSCCRSRAWHVGHAVRLHRLDRDGNTVRGLTFYDQKETPGLGGEIGNPKWQALWQGRKAYDANWEPQAHRHQGPGRAAGPGPAPDRRPVRRDDHQQRRRPADRLLAVRATATPRTSSTCARERNRDRIDDPLRQARARRARRADHRQQPDRRAGARHLLGAGGDDPDRQGAGDGASASRS